MNQKERRILQEFPKKLDEIVNETFGEEVNCTTKLNFFENMSYTTYFEAKGERRKEIEAFINGFMKGNEELRTRLELA